MPIDGTGVDEDIPCHDGWREGPGGDAAENCFMLSGAAHSVNSCEPEVAPRLVPPRKVAQDHRIQANKRSTRVADAWHWQKNGRLATTESRCLNIHSPRNTEGGSTSKLV